MSVTMRQMLEAGVHFGHQTRYWNPKTILGPKIQQRRIRLPGIRPPPPVALIP